MNKFTVNVRQSLILILALMILVGTVIFCNRSKSSAKSDVEPGEWTPKIGGCGGVFFNASPGPLIIEIEKQDFNRARANAPFRIVLAGPDRKVIYDQLISNDGISQDGGNDTVQSLRMETHVEHSGVYVMMLTSPDDRYGEYIRWRFRTNCRKYMIETSRGHRDAQHEEPIVLRDPKRETDLCFLPQRKAFDLVITNLSDSLESLELKDVHDNQLAILKVKNDTAFYSFHDENRTAIPWKLHFKKAQGKVEIGGVTRWDTSDESDFFAGFPNGSLWTPDADSWFSIHENRWLIAPHSRTVFGLPGENKSITFKIHNNGSEVKKVKLDLEFPGKKWRVYLSDNQVELRPNEEKEISLKWTGMSDDQIVHLRAKVDDYVTYATLYANTGVSPAKLFIRPPLVLKPYCHENEQWGYLPDYPLNNQMYFNINNKPFVCTSDGITSFNNGKWEEVKLNGLQSSIIAFDADGDLYAIGTENNQAVLMHSRDEGKTFSIYKIPGNSANSSFDMEQYTGYNIPTGAPPIARYTRKEADKNHFWRRYGDLELLIPKKTENGIEWEKPILISTKCLGVSSHSGIPSSVVSSGSKIFLVWGEVTDPEVSKEKIPGVPAYVTSYNRATGKIDKPVLVGYGSPPNDVHNIHSITMDGDGYLHILTGTHGRPFNYARSVEPENVHGGWTKAEPVMKAENSRSTQTYIGLVAGPDNTLHLVFRLWRYNTEYFPYGYFASLAYMSKKPDEPWSKPRLLVVAPLCNYSVYYHRLTIDRKGRLFLSYDYWSTYWFYRTERRGSQRALLMSSDGGVNWKLADNEDFRFQ